MDFVKETAIKKYISEKELRSSTEAINFLSSKANELLAEIIDEAVKNTVDGEKKTVMPNDMMAAYEQIIKRVDLEWNEILGQILQETPANLGNLNKGIENYLGNFSG